MQVFDCHFHIEEGIEKYNIPVIGRNIIFNSIDSYRKNQQQAKPEDAVSLILEYRENLAFVKEQLASKKINGLKIHSRLQHIAEDDYPKLTEGMLQLMPLQVPVIIDAFYYGSDMEFQPNLEQIALLCRQFKDVRFIIAHSGGYNVLKYFYHLKELPNVYFDLSFSLAYLKNTSVFTDFKNLVRRASPERLLFGTDFPFIDAKNQLDIFLEIAKQAGLSQDAVNKILYLNSATIFFNEQSTI